ncbi:hypothetical protein PPACK8108_LOCUS9352 [Phakopsora pachyrhizi]|uniref:Uncharacterized protein n=1 Tax=Phakopsora pachyrhizi TaxID=170000 RepID=A0AAV0AXY4_PHAPC|nr:hypothetical protein PPACK8108_LOCUS9352 [Phakopsora pachyrhizi]
MGYPQYLMAKPQEEISFRKLSNGYPIQSAQEDPRETQSKQCLSDNEHKRWDESYQVADAIPSSVTTSEPGQMHKNRTRVYQNYRLANMFLGSSSQDKLGGLTTGHPITSKALFVIVLGVHLPGGDTNYLLVSDGSGNKNLDNR